MASKPVKMANIRKPPAQAVMLALRKAGKAGILRRKRDGNRKVNVDVGGR